MVTDLECATFALAYLDAAIREGRGLVTFSITESGDVGVWLFNGGEEEAKAHGRGDTAEEALIDCAYRGLFPHIRLVASETLREDAE